MLLLLLRLHGAGDPLSLVMLRQLCAEAPCHLLAVCNAEGAVRPVAWHHGRTPAARGVLTTHAHLKHVTAAI
jgi:hypothetical protein